MAVQAAWVAIVGQTNRWTQVVPLFEGLGDTVALHGSYALAPVPGVPEPGTLALFGLALAAFRLTRKGPRRAA